MKRWMAMLLAIGALLCTGCLKAHSLDRYGYVIAVGFDRGEDMPYKITLMLQKLRLESEDEMTAGFSLVSAECSGLFDAINTLSGSLPFTLDFSRVMMLVFAQELMREEGVLDELLSVSFPKLRIRYNANVYVSLGKAEDVFKGMENSMESNLSKIQRSYMLYAKSTGLVPVNNITLFSEAVGQKYEEAVLPLCGRSVDASDLSAQDGKALLGGTPLVDSEMKTGLAGAALFSGSRMAGVLDGQSTQLLLMALGEFYEGHIRLENEDGREVSLFISAESPPEVEMRLAPTPAAKVSVHLSASPQQPESMDIESLNALGQTLERQLEDRLGELFRLCQSYESDAMAFGRSAAKQFATAEDWADYDWNAAYQSMSATFFVSVTMDQAAGSALLD